MLKERIQEILEFTKSESPYRKANKGWINQDIFLDLSPSDEKYKQRSEAAKVTIFWSPINILFGNIFFIIILGSIIVFTSVSFEKNRFDSNLFNNFGINDITNVDENKSLNVSNLKDINSIKSKSEKDLETKEIEKTNQSSSFDDDLNILEEEIIIKKIDKQDSLIKKGESKEEIKILQNKKTKSNLI